MLSKRRTVLAVSVVIISAIVLVPFYFSYIDIKASIDSLYNELTSIPKPTTVQIPMYFTLNGSYPIGRINETDFAFLLEFTYPNETLAVGEPISINATVVIDRVIETLDHVTVVIPNSLSILSEMVIIVCLSKVF
jgi:hypothetical protein